MPFSFNPTAQGGNQEGSSSPKEVGFTPSVNTSLPLSDTPSLPETPFLFLQQRGEDKSTGAYVQVLLITVFTLSIISSIVLFAYSFYLQKSVAAKKSIVEERETTFKDYPFDEMKSVYKQMTLLDALLKEYASARTPLLLLEKVIENEVLVSNFSLSRDMSGKYNMQITALTSNYKVLVQQLEALKLASYAKVAPSQKINKIQEAKQNKNGQIEVQIAVPLMIQGMHPDTVIFENIIDSSRQIATSTQSVGNERESSSSTNQN